MRSVFLFALLDLVFASSTLKGTFTPVNSTHSTLQFTGPVSPPDDVSKILDPALASFSIETAFFVEYVGNASAPNNLTRALLSNLKDRTGTPAQIRIGGITADSTFWNASQVAALFNVIDDTGALLNTTIGPAFWDAVKLLPEETRIVMTLDLHNLDYQGALSVAEATWKGLDPGQLMAFEIGNEPDHYLDFTPENYTSIWEPWSINISSALGLNGPEFQLAATVDDPLWPYNSPGASSQLDCVSTLAAGVGEDHTIKTCSEHTYQYSVCDPTRTIQATLPNLVNHTRLAQYLDLWQPRIQGVREQLGSDAFVIGEYNSVSCSGRDGVSNTFGQALWLLDTTLYAASINVSRLYVHQGGPLALQSSVQLNHGGLSFYNLWYPVDNQNGPVQVFPSYSAYLFVTEAIGHSTSLRIANVFPGRQANGSSITTAGGDTSAGQVSVYAFWEDAASHPSRLALLNLQIFNTTETDLRPSVSMDLSLFAGKRRVRARRLSAPGADVKTANMTTWAGLEFSTGTGIGKVEEEEITSGKVDVEASQAVLVFFD